MQPLRGCAVYNCNFFFGGTEHWFTGYCGKWYHKCNVLILQM